MQTNVNNTIFTVVAESNGEKFDLVFEIPGVTTPEMWKSTETKFRSLLSMMVQGEVVEPVVAEEVPTEDTVEACGAEKVEEAKAEVA